MREREVARSESGDATDCSTLNDQIIEDRARFYAAARRDLGISSGDILDGALAGTGYWR